MDQDSIDNIIKHKLLHGMFVCFYFLQFIESEVIWSTLHTKCLFVQMY